MSLIHFGICMSEALVAAGVDAVVIDSSQGDSVPLRQLQKPESLPM